MNQNKRLKVGIALGSGGGRGLAHIGVLKVLEENNIPIDFIAGSSIGALIGGFYASGLSISKIEEIALSTNWRKIFSIIDLNYKQGLIKGDKLKFFIEKNLINKKFEKCKIPFIAVATDLKTGSTITFNKGNLATAIRASISIPLIFRPLKIGKYILADGGLSSPVPVDIARQMGAQIIIAVNLDNHNLNKSWVPKWYGPAEESLSILRHHLGHLSSRNADIVLDINTGNTYWYEFFNGKDKILLGEESAKKAIQNIKKLLYR